MAVGGGTRAATELNSNDGPWPFVPALFARMHMPNWCECDLYIEGPREKVEAFLAAVKTEETLFDFDRIVPLPPELSAVESGSQELGYRAKYGSDADIANLL